MSMEEDLARLVRETVRVEMDNHMRNRASELIGRGGDTVVGGMGNIYLQPGSNKKAYYKGVEIGTGTGGGVISGSGTPNYIPKLITATTIGNSHLIDDGSTIESSEDIEMIACATCYHADVKTGEIESKKASSEGTDYYGIQITPSNMYGTHPGNFYIGDYYSAPAGVGIKMMDTRLDLIAVSGTSIYLGTGTTQIASISTGGAGWMVNVQPSSADTYDLGTSTYWWKYTYSQRYYIDDASTYILNNAGDVELHVASGKVVKIVVG